MLRPVAVIPLLLSVSTVLAEPLLYVCERPAWDGKSGCGPNDSYSTHTFLVETRDFGKEQPEYEYRGGKGCEVEKKAAYRYHYRVEPETLTFRFAQLPRAPRDKLWTSVTLDRNTMTAVLDGVDHGSELVCRVEKVTR